LPDKVVLPVTARVDCRVAVPATVRDEDREAAPWTVKVFSKVEGDLERKVSELFPPKETPLAERLVKEPNWPEKDLAEKEPVADIELVVIASAVNLVVVIPPAADKKEVLMDWGLKEPLIVKLLRTVLPLTARSLSKVTRLVTFKGEAILTAPPSVTVRFLVCKKLSAIRLAKV